MACYLIFSLASLFYSTGLQSANGTQSYESCGLITGEYVTVLQLVSRGFSPEALKRTLPDISKRAQERIDALAQMANREGMIDSYSHVYSEYAKCAKRVYDNSGIPPPGTREAHFHQCAGENKTGYEITLAALIGASESEVVEQLSTPLKPKARALFEEFRAGGRVSLFDTLASELKRCLAAIP